MSKRFSVFKSLLCLHIRRNLHTMRTRPRLAILECDTALPGITKKYGGYGGLFKVLLNAGARAEGFEKLDDALDVTIYHIEDDPDNYPDLNDIDALLLTGSRKYITIQYVAGFNSSVQGTTLSLILRGL